MSKFTFLRSAAGPKPPTASSLAPSSAFATAPTRSSVGAPAAAEDPLKFSFDLTDPGKSLFGVLGGAASLVGGVVGGIGEIGIPGGPQIKDAAVPLADLATKNPVSSAIGGAVGGLVGGAFEAITGPGQAVEEVEARNRLRAASGQAGYAGNTFFDQLFDFFSGKENEGVVANLGLVPSERATATQRAGLPPDILARLDSGESIDALAEDMANRGQGYSSNLTVEFAKGILYDPINVIGGIIPKMVGFARAEGRALSTAESAATLSRAEVLTGKTYNLLSGGLNKGRQAMVQRALGPVTSGVLHHVGIDNYTGLMSGLKKLNPAYSSALDDALSVGNGTLVRAVIGERIGTFYQGVIDRVADRVDDIRNVLPAREVVEQEIAGRLVAAEAQRGTLEKAIQSSISKVAPDFEELTALERSNVSANRLAAITDMAPEAAAKLLGKNVSVGQAQLIHLAYYGKAVDDLVIARAASVGSKSSLPLERITLIAPDTLDEATAIALRGEILNGTAEGIEDAVKHYSILRDRFLGNRHTETDIADYLKQLLDNDSLPFLVREASSGSDPLPRAISMWKEKYGKEAGYKLGFAPESGWKAIIGKDGGLTVTDPFIHLQGYREAMTVRNPIGRFADSLMRGITQDIIINEGIHRSVLASQRLKTGVAPAKIRTAYRSILHRGVMEQSTPRGLAGVHIKDAYKVIDENGAIIRQNGNAIDEEFARFLTPEEMTSLREVVSPTTLMMHGLEGNFNRVGATQKFTGAVKTIGADTRFNVAALAEHIYPMVRFKYNPFFQLQEWLESPFWNGLRGIKNEIIDPEVQAAYAAAGAGPDFRLVAEAGHITDIAGQQAAQQIAGRMTPIGKALARFTGLPVQETKQRLAAAQAFAEHGAEFEKEVTRINPALWQTMIEGYGTTDANEIARRFITERLQLATGQIDEAMDAAGIGARAAGMSADEATIAEAWRESFARASKQAFKTHFFDPERGWLERTLNHPFLGLYPLSYMWGKVVPEFARFALVRPFGLNAPLTGYAAMLRLQRGLLDWQNDPEWAKFLKDHQETIYFVELLLPGQPTDAPVNAPSWARHLLNTARSGGEITSEQVEREVGQFIQNVGTKPISGLALGWGAAGEIVGGDVFENLSRAAEQWDLQFGPPEKPEKF